MNKPYISKREWEEKIKSTLAAKGVEARDRQKMEVYLWASFDRDPGHDYAGINEKEVEEIIEELRKRKNEHHISESKIAILEAQLRKYL